ncbi:MULTISPECIES: hypothetical protein [Aneurinibacillus]|uniref:DUF2157 domain-containing protein n=1 Tax=Aneurinibacillus thermoaerophilus TaxID=143495 RepID=A0A1G7Z3L6_ANETH|nr:MULTISPECIES: hypothetical protein [Aneurinibacillus]AMA72370.1 hypothetical protein ACH33_05550 [Aneurinibacillus sp. XH2]MED0674771.1 hypothetical protein [Aneurinibacillus thermoaerophilus]MED0735753.1 hypothetical protein [Aneurinibacillus thermoaerophilus]SDH03308.1 hypothetical protein SAMN04489735_100917 [Aneurinibacillus thermoaerophilus]
MNEQKKKIITSEIEYWRTNNLLPRQYCDFLLNLYTEGEAAAKHTRNETTVTFEALPIFSVPKPEAKWAGIALFIIVLFYLAFHFTDFTLTMQMALIGFLTLFFYILGFVKRQKVSSHVFLGLASVLLALGGVYVLGFYGYGAMEIISYVAASCLIWYIVGITAGKRYFSFCALLGFQGIYGWITYCEVYDQFTWWRMEAFWIPVAMLLLTFGLLWKRRQQRTSAVLFFNGILALFGAEIATLFIASTDKDLLLSFFYLKIFIASFLLLSLKNFWWPWFGDRYSLH